MSGNSSSSSAISDSKTKFNDRGFSNSFLKDRYVLKRSEKKIIRWEGEGSKIFFVIFRANQKRKDCLTRRLVKERGGHYSIVHGIC